MGQLVLFAAIAAAGLVGPFWGGGLRAAGIAAGALLLGPGTYLMMRGLTDLRENLTPFPRPLPQAHLVESGAYRLARHPIYGGFILAACGWGLATASPLALLAAFALAVFFDLKSRREEVWLSEQFPGYAAYRARTKRLLPWIY